MAAEEQSFLDTKTGGFLAGVGIGVLIFCAIRFGPPLVIGTVLSKAPRTIGGKIASAILEDVSIGRVPLLHVGTPVTIATVLGSLFTVSFYLFGGLHQLIEMGKSMLGIPISGTGHPDEASVAGETSFDPIIFQQSEYGRMIFVALNGARRDP